MNFIARFFRRFVDAIKKVFGGNKKYQQYVYDAEKLLGVFERAIKADGNKKISGGAETRDAIVKLDDGKIYVQAEEQVIKSDNPELWENEIIDYVNRIVRKGKDVEITLDNGEVLKITGRTAWKLGYRNVVNDIPISDDIYLVKGNAAGVIDEIISASELRSTKSLLKERKGDFAKHGFDYRRAYFRDLDGKYYELKISVGINNDGKEVYNIGNIIEKEMPKSVDGSKTVNGSKAKTDKKASLGKSITQDNPIVNTKSALSSKSTKTDQTTTQNFKNWFGDWQNSPETASKIVNADGTPMIMYHGSPEQFTVFDKSKAKASGAYGRGFYFTNSDSHAKQYGNLYAVYLDVKNPLKQGETKVTDFDVLNYSKQLICFLTYRDN